MRVGPVQSEPGALAKRLGLRFRLGLELIQKTERLLKQGHYEDALIAARIVLALSDSAENPDFTDRAERSRTYYGTMFAIFGRRVLTTFAPEEIRDTRSPIYRVDLAWRRFGRHVRI
jgi:hypothetical protein